MRFMSPVGPDTHDFNIFINLNWLLFSMKCKGARYFHYYT